VARIREECSPTEVFGHRQHAGVRRLVGHFRRLPHFGGLPAGRVAGAGALEVVGEADLARAPDLIIMPGHGLGDLAREPELERVLGHTGATDDPVVADGVVLGNHHPCEGRFAPGLADLDLHQVALVLDQEDA